MRVLVFDTETNDKAKDFKGSYKETNNWPRVIQLAYEIYNDGNLEESWQGVVKPVDFDIAPGAEAVHGISKEKAMKVGMDRMEVLLRFIKAVKSVDMLVCHNTQFDINVMGCELHRIDHPNILLNKDILCTMKSTTEHCKLMTPWGSGYKWPSLTELHTILFNEGFDGAHDALSDVKATARCFNELWSKGIINKDGFIKNNKRSKRVLSELDALKSSVKKSKSPKSRKASLLKKIGEI